MDQRDNNSTPYYTVKMLQIFLEPQYKILKQAQNMR